MDREKIEVDQKINIVDLDLEYYNASTNLFLKNTKEETIKIRTVTLVEIIKSIQELKDEITNLKDKERLNKKECNCNLF